MPGKGRAKVHECDDSHVNVVYVHTLTFRSCGINLRCGYETWRIRGSDASRKTVYGVNTRFLETKEIHLVTLSSVDEFVGAPGFVTVMGCGIAVVIAIMDKNCSQRMMSFIMEKCYGGRGVASIDNRYSVAKDKRHSKYALIRLAWSGA